MSDLFDSDQELNREQTIGGIDLGKLRPAGEGNQVIKPKGRISENVVFYISVPKYYCN